MVTSSIDGRIRIRDGSLCDAGKASVVEAALKTTTGVKSAAVNCRTGSLLVEYDPARLGTTEILEVAGLKEDAPTHSPAAPKRPLTEREIRARNMRIAKRGMLGSLAALLAFAAVDRERAHIAAGGLFVAFNAYHLYTYRRRLLA